MAGARNERRGANGQQVFNHCFPHAVAIGGVLDDGRTGAAHQPAQALLAGVDGRIHTRVGQVHGLAVHGVQHLVGHRGGAGGVQ